MRRGAKANFRATYTGYPVRVPVIRLPRVWRIKRTGAWRLTTELRLLLFSRNVLGCFLCVVSLVLVGFRMLYQVS